MSDDIQDVKDAIDKHEEELVDLERLANKLKNKATEGETVDSNICPDTTNSKV